MNDLISEYQQYQEATIDDDEYEGEGDDLEQDEAWRVAIFPRNINLALFLPAELCTLVFLNKSESLSWGVFMNWSFWMPGILLAR